MIAPVRKCPRCKRRVELTGRVQIKLDKWWFPRLTFRVCDDCVVEMGEQMRRIEERR